MQGSSTSAAPPTTARHPLHLFDEFLSDLPTGGASADEAKAGAELAGASAPPPRADEARVRRILRAADFLYGEGVAGRTVLDSALEILDGGAGACVGCSTHGAGGEGPPGSALASARQPVRLCRARPSGREAFLVRGSGRSGGGGGRGRPPASASDYLCLLGPVGSSAGCFCPCRSFLERTKLDRRALCKHLLAARLGPYLGMGYEEIEVSDEEFADLFGAHAI